MTKIGWFSMRASGEGIRWQYLVAYGKMNCLHREPGTETEKAVYFKS